MLTVKDPVRGFLASVGVSPQILVKFQFNPTQLSDKRAVTYASLNAPGLVMPTRQYSQGADRTLTFTVHLDAQALPADNQASPIELDDDGSLIPELNKYRAFVYPQTENWKQAGASFMPLFAGSNQFASPPACRFGFGSGGTTEPRVIDCVVTDVGIEELRFTPQLAPIRADVSLTLVELSPYGNAPPGGGALGAGIT
jgi:hypothetical protein